MYAMKSPVWLVELVLRKYGSELDTGRSTKRLDMGRSIQRTLDACRDIELNILLFVFVSSVIGRLRPASSAFNYCSRGFRFVECLL